MAEENAMLYERPFEYVFATVKPMRDKVNRDIRRRNWWRLGETMPKLRAAIKPIKRFIATPRVAKHRLFTWLDSSILPDCQLVVITRTDDTCFGILHSRFHELWALRMGTSLEDRPRYTPTTTFETFPFPEGVLTSPDPDAQFPEIAAAAKALDQHRENWLNPVKYIDWAQTPEEEEAGFPKRPVAKPGCEAELKKLTLTNLYNQRPNWLKNDHEALDKAVAAAYGWEDYSPAWTDEDILSRLLALNLERAKAQIAKPENNPGELERKGVE